MVPPFWGHYSLEQLGVEGEEAEMGWVVVLRRSYGLVRPAKRTVHVTYNNKYNNSSSLLLDRARHTGGRINLNFLAPPYGVAFLNP